MYGSGDWITKVYLRHLLDANIGVSSLLSNRDPTSLLRSLRPLGQIKRREIKKPPADADDVFMAPRAGHGLCFYLLRPTIRIAVTAKAMPRYTDIDNCSFRISTPSMFIRTRLEAANNAIVFPTSICVNTNNCPNVANVRIATYTTNHHAKNVAALKPCVDM